jgi:Predicted transcriptional regulator
MKESIKVAEARRLLASGEAKQIRLSRRVEISTIARDLGVSEATVWRWENGQRVPRGPVAARYAQILERLRIVGEVNQ